jgi:type I restriction enzyme R subunit
MLESALENNFINWLTDIGYSYNSSIKNYDSLVSNLKAKLEKLNNQTYTEEEFKYILLKLENGTIIGKSKLLKERDHNIKLDGKGSDIFFKLFDFDNIYNNSFEVINQLVIEDNRYDVNILINGIPMIHIELKKAGIGLNKALEQINRYHKTSYKDRPLLNTTQIFIISSEAGSKYFVNSKELPTIHTKNCFYWKDIDNENISNLKDLTNTLLQRSTIFDMIFNFIVSEDENKNLIARAYQYYGAKAILESYNLLHNSHKLGYIWHTTGSGKTLTSFLTANLLSKIDNIDKVLFVVDRKDLDYQTFIEFNKFCHFKDDISDNDSTKILIEQLKDSNSKIIITTIHKLTKIANSNNNDDLRDLNIVAMFDECHRSQFGKSHADIVRFFHNIKIAGFTGTPILRKDDSDKAIDHMTTYDRFGKRLHAYILQDAISDENVLPFSLDIIKSVGDDVEIDYSDIERKREIVKHILSIHNIKTHNRIFNSIFTVNSIKDLKDYYSLFKEMNHDLNIAAIFSYSHSEDNTLNRDYLNEIIEDYNSTYNQKFDITNNNQDEFYNYYKDLVNRIKNHNLKDRLDIVLVVNIFLTGFDSKLLNTLYVDKNLRTHNIIQAFSRTNRVLDKKGYNKTHGNIICFDQPTKTTIDEAIALYSDNKDDSNILLKPYEEYKVLLESSISKLKSIANEPKDVVNIKSEEQIVQFIETFKEVIRLKTEAQTYIDYNEDDYSIDNYTLDKYQSQYIDLKDRYEKEDKPESILTNIDYELNTLFSNIEINSDYIMNLLKTDSQEGVDIESVKEKILTKINTDVELRPKRELIESFIERYYPIEKDVDIFDLFHDYSLEHKEKKIIEIANDYYLDLDGLKEIIETKNKNDSSRPINTGDINNMALGELGLSERNYIANRLDTDLIMLNRVYG